ncbi:MAG: hypothetical protein UX80_C0013G0003 [Candidatus Amesbacteria bacterium GW2011_GWA2_47_11b]|uniref:Uncharacterized protein n=3 Tax=Candidatus Amesiibacteriota TaxID=1752730 RepID=A0A0G1SK74_9BACT|nr:MAG: hypothetical protein UX80_C0013G0003 [Candidatus Amesbacteria bacterium GW2011_GWA2_47_11b]KKU69842.1 MAG: hypothetical protein UX92_C0008G0010 [Candidatus Amesbacteria bacterium GW2011_GWA1_47_20]KKU84651.1 MAG: hypothetical protein UY11_C0005G0025 [Candidatus Amesbacteria bacterium GW2011_GWC2_47_8]
MDKYEAVTWAEEIEVRFAYSGKVAHVAKKAGDRVNKGNLLASLDRKMLQAELDRQLADFERTRAEFEIAAKKLGGSETDVYLKKGEQARLNVAVKDVELAKYKLDMADLFCPVNGLVKSAGGLRPGLNVSPASNPFVIIDLDTLVYRLRVAAKDVEKFKAKAKTLIPDTPGYFMVDMVIENKTDLLPGMPGLIKAV